MTIFKLFTTMSVVALLTVPVQATSHIQSDPHHPEQGAATTDVVPAGPAQQDMMMNMMAGMMKMMSGGMMGQSGMDMQSMGMTQRVEGRIAFLRAELQITDKQTQVWDAFADALRKNAKGMMDAGMPMMGADAEPGLANRLDAQERVLSARLDGVKAMKAALVPLYEALDEAQRQSADELLAPHMGMMAGGMMQGGMGNMMQGGMMPGQSSGQ
jgi:hypothetical protein